MNFKDYKNVEDCLKAKGIDSSTLDEHFSWMAEHRRAFSKIQFILETVVECINGSWVADWSDIEQQKWYNYWRFDVASGFGFAIATTGYGCTSSCVGSRLVFENKEKAEHAAKFFIDLYRQYYLTCGVANVEGVQSEW